MSVDRMRWVTLACLTLAACGDPAGADAGPPSPDAGGRDAGVDGGEAPLVPDLYCPGDPGCPDEGDDALHAGAAAVTITPSFDEVDAITVDVDGDGVFEPEEGDEFDDRNGDGRYDAIWLAGFGNNRGATSVLDDTWARAVALRQNETTIVFVALDVVGFFLDDIEPIRERAAALGVDFVSVSATHDHQGRDTIGIWGASLGESGRSEDYIAFIQERAFDAVRQAVEALEPARIQYASLRVRDVEGGVRRIVSDTRDPQVIDDEARVLRFLRTDETTIATLINFGAHPEYMGSRNTALSSDFAHWLREGVEGGVEGPDGARADGVGGVCVFVNGAVGSQIGPGDVQLRTWAGAEVPRGSAEAAMTMGSQLAWHVLGALGPAGGSVTDETADLAVRRTRFFIRIENRRYHVAYLQGLLPRAVYHYDPDRAIRSGVNEPDVLSEIAVVDVGRATMLTIPGELDPALFLGGYDGAYAPDGLPVVDTTRTNPPDLSMAPDGPYLRDLARGDAEQVWLLGLTNDFLGYFIPEFDYQLDPGLPYIGEAPGDHYEETNSIGASGWPRLHDKLVELLAYRR